MIDYDVTITPNPSYTVGQNSSYSRKESDYQYDYVQPDDGVVKQLGYATSGGGQDEVTVNNVIMDTNPSYSTAQDVSVMEDNPSYDKL